MVSLKSHFDTEEKDIPGIFPLFIFIDALHDFSQPKQS